MAEEQYEEISVDLNEDVSKVLHEEMDLSESAQNKIQDLIETTVNEKVKEKEEQLKEDYENKIEEEKETILENADDYLTYAVKEWKKENEVALEQGAKAEVTESLLSDLKQVFENHNVNMPEEKVDQVEELNKKVSKLEDKLNDTINEKKDLEEKLVEGAKEQVTREVGQNLAETDFERFQDLLEDAEYVSEDRFRSKAETVLETYFATGNANKEQEKTTVSESAPEDDIISQAARFL